MRFHVLCGLPRSGTTLLANVLSQHPDVHVSGTSALPICVEAVADRLSTVPEVMSDLANVPGAYGRYVSSLRGLVDGWYADRPEEVVIDKGRGWVMHRLLLEQVVPGSQMVVCVRDPRDVIASIERQHRQTGVFNSPLARTIWEAADLLMRPDGMVGGPMRFIEDLLRRSLPGVCWVRYESLVADPATVVGKVHDALGLEAHTYDFEAVENQASDLDAIYRNKWPHDGSGKIKPSGRSWQEVLDPNLAAQIARTYPGYMQTFAYA